MKNNNAVELSSAPLFTIEHIEEIIRNLGGKKIRPLNSHNNEDRSDLALLTDSLNHIADWFTSRTRLTENGIPDSNAVVDAFSTLNRFIEARKWECERRKNDLDFEILDREDKLYSAFAAFRERFNEYEGMLLIDAALAASRLRKWSDIAGPIAACFMAAMRRTNGDLGHSDGPVAKFTAEIIKKMPCRPQNSYEAIVRELKRTFAAKPWTGGANP